jgi:uncharacterized protein (TIGR02466 family)
MNEARWQANVHHLFPTALFAFSIADYASLNQPLLETIYRLKQQDTGASASNVLGWHSKSTLFELDEIKPLKSLIDAAVLEVSQTVGYGNVQIKAANCWANVNPKYASNKIHDHANCLLSGVYYVKAPKDSGQLMFYDPRSAKTFYKPLVSNFTAYTADAIAHAAEEGLMLIFPSWLKHGVEPNLSNEDRVSISFNYVFV